MKTSLIITGDAKSAKAEVDALRAAVEATGASAAKVTPQTDALSTSVDGAADSARDAAGAMGELDSAIGDAASAASKGAASAGGLDGAINSVGQSARGAAGDVSQIDNALSAMGQSVADAIARATGLDGALSGMGASSAEASGLADDLKDSLGGMAKGALESSAAQAAVSKASGVAATAMAGLGVSASTVEAILTGGLSLALTAAIGFLSGFAAEALSGAGALGEEEKAAASLTEQIAELNKALERETRTQYSAQVQTLANAEALRHQAVAAIEARKALLGKALAEQQNSPDRLTLAQPGANIRASQGMALASTVLDLQRQLKIAETDLAVANGTLGKARQYFVDRGIAAATEPRARIALTYDQGLDRLDRRRDQLSEAQYAREKIQLDKDRKAALDALSTSEGRAAGSSRALASTRSAASAADRAAADAQKTLQADLDRVTGRYDPARKAASDYADELERIAKLAAAGKISGEDAASYKAQASAAYLGKAIDWTGIKGAAGDEQAAIDAAAAIDKIVQSIHDETAAMAALNPAQREYLGYRQQLLALSPDERAAAEARIQAAMAERDAAAAARQASADARRAQIELGQAAVDAFTAIVVGGQKASDVINRLAKNIAAAAIEATIFGTGPLAALLKGASRTGKGTADAGAGGTADMVGRSVSKSVTGALDTSLDKVFGIQGSFGKTLRNAGLGYAAGSATGSATGGAIGGTIGGYAAEKLLSKTLGSLAGPLGSIAGGLIGGAIGGLLKKTQTGAANITSVDGAATVSGNNSGYKQAASAAASNVQDGLSSIAEQLGGAVGSFNVTIGQRHGDWRVRSGTGSLKIKAGATEFDDDQAGAIAYAIQLAVSQGAVTGLSTAVQKALNSSPDLDKALGEALKVQEVETMLGGVGAELASQFKTFEAQAKDRLRIAQQYGFDIVAIEKKNAEDRAKLVDQILKERIGSLQSFLDDMQFGNLAEGSIADQRTALLAQIAKARSSAEAGEDGAADTLASLSRQLIELSREGFGTAGSEYAADRNTAAEAAQAVIKAEKDRVAAASGDTAATNAKLDETNETLDEQTGLLEDMNSTLQQLLTAVTGGAAGVSADTSLVARAQ